MSEEKKTTELTLEEQKDLIIDKGSQVLEYTKSIASTPYRRIKKEKKQQLQKLQQELLAIKTDNEVLKDFQQAVAYQATAFISDRNQNRKAAISKVNQFYKKYEIDAQAFTPQNINVGVGQNYVRTTDPNLILAALAKKSDKQKAFEENVQTSVANKLLSEQKKVVEVQAPQTVEQTKKTPVAPQALDSTPNIFATAKKQETVEKSLRTYSALPKKEFSLSNAYADLRKKESYESVTLKDKALSFGLGLASGATLVYDLSKSAFTGFTNLNRKVNEQIIKQNPISKLINFKETKEEIKQSADYFVSGKIAQDVKEIPAKAVKTADAVLYTVANSVEINPGSQIASAYFAGNVVSDILVPEATVKVIGKASKAATKLQNYYDFEVKLKTPVDEGYSFQPFKENEYVPFRIEEYQFRSTNNKLLPSNSPYKESTLKGSSSVVIETVKKENIPAGFYVTDIKKAARLQEEFGVPVDPYLQQTNEFQTQLYPKKVEPLEKAQVKYYPKALEAEGKKLSTADLTYYGAQETYTGISELKVEIPTRQTLLNNFESKQLPYVIEAKAEKKIELIPGISGKRGQQSLLQQSFYSKSRTNFQTPQERLDIVKVLQANPKNIRFSPYLFPSALTSLETAVVPQQLLSQPLVLSSLIEPAVIQKEPVNNVQLASINSQPVLIKEKIDTITKFEQKSDLRLINPTKQYLKTSDVLNAVGQEVGINQIQSQSQKEKTEQILSFFPSKTSNTVYKKEKSPFETYKSKLRSQVRLPNNTRSITGFEQGFDVFTRAGGQLVKINTEPLNKQDALKFGALFVGSTARASFNIKESDSKATGEFTGANLLNQFAKNKAGFFVEKNKFRIDSPGEKREITQKGMAKRRSKSILSGVFDK